MEGGTVIVSDTFPNLINGVSQQAGALRLNSQVEALENSVCSVVDGLHKRQPTQHIAKLTSGDLTGSYVYLINRDSTERYIVIATNGALRIYNLAGELMTILAPDGVDYLGISNEPFESFRMVTVADTTFIVNREREVSMMNTTSDPITQGGLVWIRLGLIGHEYHIALNGVEVANYSDTTSTTLVKSSDVAAALAVQILAHTGGQYAISILENVFYIGRVDGAAFAMTVWDTYGNQAMSLVKDRVASLADLPDKAFPNMRVKVQGDAASSADDYWVKFLVDAGTTVGRGVWAEDIGPGVATNLEVFSMPFILQRTATDTFTFKKAPWANLTVGDDSTVKQPSFVGQTINDVFVYRGRLGVVAGENVVFTQAAEFYNFWPTTVTTLLDDDRIDYQVGGTGVAELYHAIPFQDRLLLFSDQSQLTLTAGDALTAKTVTTTVTTVFDGLINSKPTNSGNSIFFGYGRGDFSGIREYFVQSTSKINDAADITAHVPRYITGTVEGLTVSTTLNMLVARVGAGANVLYPYQWLWNNEQKIQSAWGKWTFDADPLGAAFVSEVLYLVMQRADGVFLEKIDLSKKVDDGSTYTVNLDRRCTATHSSHNLGSNTTTFTTPYYDVDMQVVFNGNRLTIASNTNNSPGATLVVTGVYTENAVAGIPYTFSVTLSKPFIKPADYKGSGVAAENAGRVQVRDFYIRYADTGFFEVQVSPDAFNQFTYDFTGRLLGADDDVTGTLQIGSGVVQVPVRSSNEKAVVTVTNSTFMPTFLLSAEWDGIYYPRSRRL